MLWTSKDDEDIMCPEEPEVEDDEEEEEAEEENYDDYEDEVQPSSRPPPLPRSPQRTAPPLVRQTTAPSRLLPQLPTANVGPPNVGVQQVTSS